MKKFLAALLLLCSPLFASSSKPSIRVIQRFQVAEVNQPFQVDGLLLGDYPSYVIIEARYKGETLVLSLHDVGITRNFAVTGVVSDLLWREESEADVLPFNEDYRADQSELDGGFDGDFQFEVLARAPSKEEWKRVNRPLEEMKANFGTDKFDKVWARTTFHVKVNCSECVQ